MLCLVAKMDCFPETVTVFNLFIRYFYGKRMGLQIGGLLKIEIIVQLLLNCAKHY
jgi:hypothetical protein